MKPTRITALMGASTAIFAAVTFGLASPAQAAPRDGACDAGEFCYYYFSRGGGSVSDFSASVADYGATQPTCYDFKGTGSGQGSCVKNNAVSAYNRSSSTVRVYYNSNYGGTSQDIPAGAFVNLAPALQNQNASHQFLTGAPQRVYLTRRLVAGEGLTSPNGRYQLRVNPTDGDMEVRALNSALPTGHRIMWSSALRCSSCNNRLVMQADGNLVLYGGTTAKWASNTMGSAGAQLALQNDGNVVIYDFGRPIWNTRTARYQNYDAAVDYIRQEMVTNAAYIRTLSAWTGARKATFVLNVMPDGPWDHKPILRRNLQLRTDDSRYLDVRGVSRTALSYDYYSNLHYGYVGRAAGFTANALIFGSKGDSLAGIADPYDDVAIRAGIRLADSNTALTNASIRQAIEASIVELRNKNAPQVRGLAW